MTISKSKERSKKRKRDDKLGDGETVSPLTEEIQQAASLLYAALETLKHLRKEQRQANATFREMTCLGGKYTSNRKTLTVLKERLIASEESLPEDKRRKHPSLAILFHDGDQSVKYSLHLKQSLKKPPFKLGLVEDLVRRSLEELSGSAGSLDALRDTLTGSKGRGRLLESMLAKVLAWKEENQTVMESVTLDRSAGKKKNLQEDEEKECEDSDEESKEDYNG